MKQIEGALCYSWNYMLHKLITIYFVLVIGVIQRHSEGKDSRRLKWILVVRPHLWTNRYKGTFPYWRANSRL